MKTLSLETAKIQTIFKQFHHHFGGNLSKEAGAPVLRLDNGFGQGLIKGFTLKGGLYYLEFDMRFSEDFMMAFDTPDRPPFHFAYCSKGRIKHRFGSEDGMRTLKNFQTGILSCRPFEDHTLFFEKDEHLKVSLITVSAPGANDSRGKGEMYTKLRRIFLKGRKAENFAFISSFNLQIAQKIQQLDFIPERGMARNLLIEGSVHMILGLEIQQHRDDKKNLLNDMGSLTAEEMERVSEISEFVENYAETDMRIKQLCRRSGLSPSKLQKGFKMMHGRTVTDYIRDVRIKKSEKMIKDTDLTISQIVYSIGFSSRSYFSKIFKQKYNCSPKKYRNNRSIAV